jgi:hypothetical protein
VEYTVNLVVKAWDDPNMPTQHVTEPILESMFHPDFHDGRCKLSHPSKDMRSRLSAQVQRMMMEKMQHWISTVNNRGEILRRLTADSVKSGGNKRIGDESAATGHVHSMLPDGGLQQVLAQHNVHVVSTNTFVRLCADLASLELRRSTLVRTSCPGRW